MGSRRRTLAGAVGFGLVVGLLTPVTEGMLPPDRLPAAHAAAAGTVLLRTPTTLNGNGAELSWDSYVATGTAPFVAYEIHRSAAAGFTPSPATLLTTITDRNTTKWTDTTAKGGATVRYRLVVGGVLSAELPVTLPASGTTTMTLQPDASRGQATQIAHNASTEVSCSDNRNYGAAPTMRVGTTADGWQHRGLLRFDLRSIPATADVTSATLTLAFAGSNNPDTAVSVHRLRQPWQEGTENATCGASGATWLETQRSVGWASTGASFDATADASLVARSRSAAGTDTFTVLGLVREWVTGAAPNDGVLVKATDDTPDGLTSPSIDYGSDDSTTTARPQLVVTYSNPQAVSRGPWVSVAAPAASSVVTGTVPLRAAGGDDGRVAKMEFLSGNTLLGSATASPWTFAWDTTSAAVASGSQVITVRATDDSGNQTTSPGVTVTVDKTAKPTVTLTGPTASTVVGTSATMTASATGTGLTKVEFYADDQLVGTDTAAPWSTTWKPGSIADPAYNTSHQLSARVFDGSGRSATSGTTTVTVSRAAGTIYSATLDLNEPGNSTTALAIPPSFLDNNLAPTTDTYSGSTTTTTSLSSTPKDSTNSYATYSGSALLSSTQRSTTSGLSTSGPSAIDTDTTNVKPIRDPASVARGALQADVTVTNTSSVAWKGGSSGLQLWYRWYVPTEVPKGDGSVGDDGIVLFEGPANTYFPSTVQPGQSKPIPVLIEPPALPVGIDKARVRLRVDIYDVNSTSADKWFATRGNPPIDQPVVVDKDLEGHLGLERFWQYEGTDTGAGSQALTNVSNGNTLWRWSPFSAPGRGLATTVDLTYNSLEDHSESPAGNNVSLAVSGLTRLGNPLDIHPNRADTISGRSNKYVTFTDGDGTTHKFTGTTQTDGTTTWAEPAGVNLYLQGPSTDPTRRYSLTRPDKVTFYFDTDGYPTSVVDRNGNTLTFTLETVLAGEDPGGPKRRITKVTDAGGRAFTIAYWSRAEVKRAHVRGKIKSIADHTGSLLLFDYYDDGNLLRLTQVGGTQANGERLDDRTFVFTYTTSNGAGPAVTTSAARAKPDPHTPNQSTRLYSVRDPRGAETVFAYYGPGTGQLRWKAKSRWNRLGDPTQACTSAAFCTAFGYDITNRRTTVDAPSSRDTEYVYDTLGRVTSLVDALEQTTSVTWSTDNKVKRLVEPGGAVQTWDYNANGYLTSWVNQVGAQTTLTYENRPLGPKDTDGHWSVLTGRTKPEGGTWVFTNDTAGNTTRTVDPEGYATTLTWNLAGSAAPGTVASTTDARNQTTSYTYDASGAPSKIAEPEGITTEMGYDADGLLRWVQDGNLSAQANPTVSGTATDRVAAAFLDYDAFHRLGRQSAPKSFEYERGRLIWSSGQFDANDNVTRNIDPHYGGTADDGEGTVGQTGTFDAMDQPLTQGNQQGETTAYTWDVAGRISSITRPKGSATTATSLDYASEYDYDVLDRVTRQTDHGSAATDTRTTLLCYDTPGDLRSVTSPRAQKTAVTCPTSGPATAPFTTAYAYDAAHRLLTKTDPLGHAQTKTYDLNNNVTVVEQLIDKAASATRVQRTTTAYDKRDLPIRSTQQVTGSRTAVSKVVYDGNGNRTLVASPRAVDHADGAAITSSSPYVTAYSYDGVNRLVQTVKPFAPGETERQSEFRAYDKSNHLLWNSLPVTSTTASAVQDTARTVRTYFGPGWIRTAKSPNQPLVTYDYAAQSWQTRRTPEVAGQPGTPDLEKEMIWRYFDDGKLSERADRDGNPTTYSYDRNNNLTYSLDTSGVVSAGENPVETSASWDGFDEISRVWHRKKASDTTPWTFNDYAYDANGNVTRRLENGEQDSAKQTVTKAPKEYELAYDEADWLSTQVNRQETNTDLTTASACDGDEYLTNTWYDTGWEEARTLRRAQSGCSGTASSWPVKQTTTWDRLDNGKVDLLKTVNASGGVITSHDVEYLESGTLANGTAGDRYVDGNRTKDTFVNKRADAGTTCTSVTNPCIATYTYDARQKLTSNQRRQGVTDTFKLDEPANLVGDTTVRGGNVTTKAEAGKPTLTQKYQSNQLKELSSGGGSVSYVYDNYGNVDCVAVGSGVSSCPTGSGLVQDYAYDDLNRLASQRTYTGATATDTATYDYDALDRVSKQTETHSTAGDNRSTSFTYEGLTTRTTEEKQSGGTDPKTKTFSYDAYGHRISMSSQDNGTTKTDSFSYAYDVHGSVSQLVDDTGGVKASYGYTAYGSEDDGLSSKQDATTDTDTNPLNPYQFQGRRLDSGGATASSASSSLDMGARRYAADTGRFLQEDMYASALGDLGLALDPLSQNRYALAGGNPISFVEVDGHRLIADGGGGGSTSPSPTTSTTSSCCTSSGSSTDGGSSPSVNLAQESLASASDVAAAEYLKQTSSGYTSAKANYAAMAERRAAWAGRMTEGGRLTGSRAEFYRYLDEAPEYSAKASASGQTAMRLSRLAKFSKGAIPVVGSVAAFGLDVANGEDPGRAGAKAVGGLVGGALAGAAAGSVFGPAGTIIGGVIGGFLGSGVGQSIFDNGVSLDSIGEGLKEGGEELLSAGEDVVGALNPFD
ncbi:Ig-like domain-containing protein [Humibacillus xanthopallidus]|nr:Ig-like domain-containing protein [Humibacillus xanthopallidus]